MPVRRLLLGAAAALTFAVLAIAAVPYLVLHSIGSGLDDRDVGAVGRHVDLPAVREDIKRTLTMQLQRKMATDGETSVLRQAGASLGRALVDQFVEQFVSPEGLRRLLSSDSETVNAWRQANRQGVYESIDRFAIFLTRAGNDHQVMKLTLARDGLLSWRITGAQLPPALVEAIGRHSAASEAGTQTLAGIASGD